jgi:hypothetical protein
VLGAPSRVLDGGGLGCDDVRLRVWIKQRCPLRRVPRRPAPCVGPPLSGRAACSHESTAGVLSTLPQTGPRGDRT